MKSPAILTRFLLSAAALCAASLSVRAEPVPALRADERVPDVFESVGIAEKSGGALPMEALFNDELGKPVSLQKYFDGERPVILNVGYYSCPMLCGLVMNGMTDSLKKIDLRPGADYVILSVSIDPTETHRLARLKKQSYLRELGKAGAAEGWHFLTGDECNIRRLTDSVGFNYKWIEDRKEYAHSAALILLTPDGRVSTYLYGISFEPAALQQLLQRAAKREVIPSSDPVVLTCLRMGPAHSNTAAAMNLMRLGGAATLIVGGALIWRALRRERLTHLRGSNVAG